MAHGRAGGREDPVEVDVDHPVPALVAVALEFALRYARPLGARPRPDEPDAGIDARVRKRDVEPAVQSRRLVDRVIEGVVVGHVSDRGPYVEPICLEAVTPAPQLDRLSTSISVTRAP